MHVLLQFIYLVKTDAVDILLHNVQTKLRATQKQMYLGSQ